MSKGQKTLSRVLCCFLILVMFVSCVTINSNANFRKKDNMIFYVYGKNDTIGLNNYILNYLKQRGFQAQTVLDVQSIRRVSEVLNPENTVSSGTGFFISDELIITCSHVVSDAKTITAVINGRKYPVTTIVDNASLDFALLRIHEYKSSKFFDVQKFTNASIGDRLYVLGYPLANVLGNDIRVTDGIISSRTGLNADPFNFQMSAPIQPGNSGGPIINESLQVIGIASSKISDRYVAQNAGVIPQNVNFG